MFSLSHWYPGSGVALDCINSWSLPSFLLLLRSLYSCFSSFCCHILFCYLLFGHFIIVILFFSSNRQKEIISEGDRKIFIYSPLYHLHAHTNNMNTEQNRYVTLRTKLLLTWLKLWYFFLKFTRVKSGIFRQTAKLRQPPGLFHSSIIGIRIN